VYSSCYYSILADIIQLQKCYYSILAHITQLEKMSAGPGAPGDRPPGDEPLGGEAKKLKDKQVAVVIPGLSMEELLKYGVLPVILPPGMLKKKK
jgi:hypothetical protein